MQLSSRVGDPRPRVGDPRLATANDANCESASLPLASPSVSPASQLAVLPAAPAASLRVNVRPPAVTSVAPPKSAPGVNSCRDRTPTLWWAFPFPFLLQMSTLLGVW